MELFIWVIGIVLIFVSLYFLLGGLVQFLAIRLATMDLNEEDNWIDTTDKNKKEVKDDHHQI